MNKIFIIIFSTILLAAPMQSGAQSDEALAVRDAVIDDIRSWLSDPVVLQSIREQNQQHTDLDEKKIKKLDQQWRTETSSSTQPLIRKVMGTELSSRLKKLKSGSGGKFTEIFVMDNKGLNVGQSDITSDYWQGDEAKWQQTFLVGKDAVHVGEIEQDESSQQFQSQISVTISDPETGAPIGAITVGVDVEAVLQ